MSTSAASAAASRCCNQLGLVRRFSSALSISSSLVSSSAAGKAGRNAFSTAAYGNKGINSHLFFATNAITRTATATTTSLSPIHTNTNNTIFYNYSSSNNNNNNGNVIRRSMATSNRKIIDAKNARRLKIQQKKKKNLNANKPASDADEAKSTEDANKNNPFLQHQEWVRFQRSIKVDGFQTGQTTTATVLKKSRGGKQARRKREKELARLGAFSDDGSTEKISAVAQKFPAIRYSPEETEDLLKQAYATLPPRDGKRGTRNLRRQETRWKKVRRIRSDYKAHQLNAHCNRMAARKYKRDRTMDALDSATNQRLQDLEYQGMVLKRYMETRDGVTEVSATASDQVA